MDLIARTIDNVDQLILLAVFVIVLIVCLRVFPEMSFEGFAGKVMAFCVAALSAIGVAMLGPWEGKSAAPYADPKPHLTFLLLPYAALGLSLLLLFLLLLVAKFWGVVQKFCGRCTERSRLFGNSEGGLKRPDSRSDKVREQRGRQHMAKKVQGGKMVRRQAPTRGIGRDGGATRPRHDGHDANRGVMTKDNRRISRS